MTYKVTVDSMRKYIEINDRAITSDEFQKIYELIDDVDGWTIHFNFNKKN